MIQPLTLQLLAQSAPQQGSLAMIINTVLPFVILGVVFWFLFLRPQKKEQQRLEHFRANLKVGDEVVTNQGIYGKIASIESTTVHLEIARNTKIKILKQEIRISAKQLDSLEAAAETVSEMEAEADQKDDKDNKKD